MNEFWIATAALLGAILGSSIAGIVSLVSIHLSSRVEQAHLYHKRIIYDFLDNGLRKLIKCCDDCLAMVNSDDFSDYSQRIEIPLGNALKLDFRYGTYFYEYFLKIDKFLKGAEDGKKVSTDVTGLLIALQYELYWFNNLQSMYIGAKSIRLFTWRISSILKFRKMRKVL